MMCRELDVTPNELESLILSLLAAEVKRRDENKLVEGGHGTWG